MKNMMLTIPRPPAFETAEASSAYPTHCIPPWTTGTTGVFSMSTSSAQTKMLTSDTQLPSEGCVKRHDRLI